ncbi:potassium channel family protein [Burkholderia cepacia]|uniref:potassium channel family protein n=1 Tax=Burkholderia cepacia TaxID=292 RepID=UPI000F5D8972|nr:potassium channel family protein [Burkholderia cepacia]
MNATQLWALPPAAFNEWRRKNDYPIIFSLFELKLSRFQEWMDSERITRDLIFQHGIARFISTEEPVVACKYANDGKVRLFLSSFEKLPSIKKAGWIVETTEYQPYLCWLKRRVTDSEFATIKASLMITERIGGRSRFMNEHFLLELGDISVQAPLLSGRLLDFTCIDNLRILGPISNDYVYLWHSSAIGLEIHGGLAFLDAHRTVFWDHGYGERKRQLTLADGIFQDLHFRECALRFHATRSAISMSSVRGIDFDATLEHTSIERSSFDAGPVTWKNYAGRERFYATVKALYAGIGKNKEAGDYFLLEKINEMMSMLFPRVTYRERWFVSKPLGKVWIATKCWASFVPKLINYLAWGFGERPFRSLATSVVAIVVCASIFYFARGSTTHDQPITSLYFSIVTFTTLGYGDISQKGSWLQLLSAFEAFGGMVLMGLFLGGFASKSKQY